MSYTFRRAPPPHVAEPEATRRERYHKAYGPSPRETFEEYEHRHDIVDGVWPQHRQENEERIQLQLDIEAKLAEIDAHPTPRRRRMIKRSRDVALERIDRDGATAIAELGEPRPERATWRVRIYYISEAGDLCAAEFGNLTEHEAERIRGGYPVRVGCESISAQAWNVAHVHHLRHGYDCRQCERPIHPGARAVAWPSECANPSQPVAGDDSEPPSLLATYGIS